MSLSIQTLLLLLIATTTASASVYQCRNSAGDLSFQDSPCKKDETTKMIDISRAVDPTPLPGLPNESTTSFKPNKGNNYPSRQVSTSKVKTKRNQCTMLAKRLIQQGKQIISECKSQREIWCRYSPEEILRRKNWQEIDSIVFNAENNIYRQPRNVGPNRTHPYKSTRSEMQRLGCKIKKWSTFDR